MWAVRVQVRLLTSPQLLQVTTISLKQDTTKPHHQLRTIRSSQPITNLPMQTRTKPNNRTSEAALFQTRSKMCAFQQGLRQFGSSVYYTLTNCILTLWTWCSSSSLSMFTQSESSKITNFKRSSLSSQNGTSPKSLMNSDKLPLQTWE